MPEDKEYQKVHLLVYMQVKSCPKMRGRKEACKWLDPDCNVGFLTCISLYNKFGKTYLFQLDFYHLRPTEGSVVGGDDDDEWQTKYVIDAYHAGNVSPISLDL